MPLVNDKDLPFGTLNPLNVNQYAPGKADLDIKRYSFLSTMKDVVKERFTPDAFNGVTEYKAIVLKQLNSEDLGLNKIAEVLGMNIGGSVRFIAKIPELHACLPSPRGEDDLDVLSMYPIFEGSQQLGMPEVGDIVRVTYQNIFKQTVPIYLGPVLGSGNVKGTGYSENSSAKNSFNNNQYPDSNSNNSSNIDTEKAQGKFNIVGAWTTGRSFKEPEKLIKRMKENRIQHVSIMLNDGSFNTRTQLWPKFHIFYPEEDILKAMKQIKEAGLSVSFTTWVKADDDWINGIKNVVAPLAKKAGISELCLDLEEPWLSFQDRKDKIELANNSTKLLAAIKSSFTGKVSVTSIVFTDFEKLDPVFKWVDMFIPQAYASVANTRNRNVGELEKTAYQFYSKYGKPIIMGAYSIASSIEGAYGLPAKNAIIASNNSSLSLGIKEIRYWWMPCIYGEIEDSIKEFIT